MVDVELYGGRLGYLEHVRTRALYAFGAYRSARDIEWGAVSRLVFVCKGNICRSPYASARARLLGVPSASFGLEAAEGAPADPAALRTARSRAVDLSAHRSARRDSCRITDDDLLVVFEPSQLAEIRRLRIDREATCDVARDLGAADPRSYSGSLWKERSILPALLLDHRCQCCGTRQENRGDNASPRSVAMRTNGPDGTLA